MAEDLRLRPEASGAAFDSLKHYFLPAIVEEIYLDDLVCA